MQGALAGAILENYAVVEIMKTWQNSARDCPIHYYRDRNAREIDLVIEADGELHPIEVKKSTSPGTELASVFKVLDSRSAPRGAGAILCLQDELSDIDAKTQLDPIWIV